MGRITHDGSNPFSTHYRIKHHKYIHKPDSEKQIPFTQISCDNSHDSFRLWQHAASTT